ncbi:MAG TPA: phosphatase PAP2 family protein [Candidatus Cloacimonadota bacterium]|nr:phosphatase PAP2 family protein [Candidatus Cloacimonadota bacterium]
MRSFRFLFLSAVLAIISVSIYGEIDSRISAYVWSYPHTVAKAAISPLDWQARDWLKAGGVVLITGSLYLLDEEIRDLVQRNRTEFGDGVADGFRRFGESWTVPALAGTALLGYLGDSEKLFDTGMLGLKSVILARSVTGGLKLLSQRNRPFRELGNQFWDEGKLSGDRDSFPSGHTTMVWAIAPVLAEQFSELKWVKPVLYSCATLTSLSRINDDKHWASDVFFGFVVGYVTAELTLADSPRFFVAPDPGLQGLVLQYRF